MNRVKLAEKIAAHYHRGQTDKSGTDYINHPRTVAGFVTTDDEKCVAWLHDVLEDTACPPVLLRVLFGKTVYGALQLMNHDKSIPYFDYIEKISHDPLAVKVKLADLRHNSDLSRLKSVTEADLERTEKYKKAIKYLEENMEEEH